MIALHLSFISGVPCLWVEQGAGGKKLPRKRSINPLHYPFDAGIPALRSALALLLPGISVTARNTDLCYAWLPSVGDLPVASSPILREIPDRAAKREIKPWLVTIRKLHEVETLQFIAAINEGAFHGSGILPGDSLYWCRDSFMPMIHMTASGSFLPGLRMTDTGAEARWMPAPDEEISQTCSALAASMPAVCRCVNESSQTPPTAPPTQILQESLSLALDAFLRMSEIPGVGVSKRASRHPASVHDAWLNALVAEDAVVQWPDRRDISVFADQLAQWQRPVHLTVASPFKLCFRISEPEENGKRSVAQQWHVDYLLASKSDQSMIVPIAELWNPKSQSLRQFDKQGNTVEFVLSALGQAAGLDPAIAKSLTSKHPSGYVLDNAGAVDFLRTRANVLRTAGFSVILPSWWVGKGSQQGISLSIKTKGKIAGLSSSTVSLNSFVSFDVQASLGGESVDLKELKALARLKMPLVQVRGQWVLIDQDQIKLALKYLEAGTQTELTARDIMRMALGASVPGLNIPINGVEAGGWLKGLLGVLRREIEVEIIEPPSGFIGALRPYQKRGYSWLEFMRRWGLGACLADDMGLGKTVQTLALVQRERENGEKKPVLLICPTSVLNNWRKEAEKFTPELKVHIHHGPDRERLTAFKKIAKKSAMVVSSYGLLQRDIETLKDVPWAGVVLDEAQNIKNPETRQAKAARSLDADYRFILTGTPVENHVGDLWSLMEFLNPGLLGNKTSFKEKFFVPIQIYRDEDTSKKLKSITGPFILRREKRDRSIISDLPDKLEMKTYCTLTREQVTLYQAVLEDMTSNVEGSEGIERSGMVLALLTKLKQVCNHPAHLLRDGSSLPDRSGKLSRLREMLTEVRDAGERALIFTQYAEMGDLLQRYLQEHFCEEVFFLHGGVTKKKRDAFVDRFQSDDRGPQIFILSLKAGGTGLTLTRANHVFHYDRWWNPAVENQATDRVFRIGQTKNVSVYKFIVAGTLEERIDEMIERKSGIAAQIVGSGEQWLSKLSNSELRSLISLSNDALGE